MSLLLHVAVCLRLPLIIAVLSGSLLNHDQGLGNIIMIILKDLDDKFKGNITILKDDKFNVRAVLGSTSKRRMDPPHRITESVLDEDIDIGKIIEAQVIVNKMLDTFEIVPADSQVALNDALEPISAFEKRLRTGRIFALNSSIDESHVHPFSKSVFYQGNHARTIKEPSAKSKDVCEVLTLGLGPVLQVTRLLAIALMEFETLSPYPRARNADGISLLLNAVSWSVLTVLRNGAASDMATREKLLDVALAGGLPEQAGLEAVLHSEKKPLSSHNVTMNGKHVRVVVVGNKNALAATPGKATSAAAAAEEDYDDGYHESFGAPEASLS